MRLEDMKYDFPKMPEEMRTMIEREVTKQVKTERPQFGKGKRAVGKTVAASIAAVMLLGSTAVAGVSIYRMQQEKVGNYGVNVSVSGNETTEGAKSEQPLVIPDVKMEVGYLPEGMVKTERGKYSFENALYQGGVSMTFFRMDQGDDQFKMQHGDVLSSEDFSANGYKGVYLEYPHLSEDEITFNQRIYVAFTDTHYVMEMFVGSDVSKEDALKIAKNISLVPTEDKSEEEFVVAQNWSDYQKGQKESQQQEEISAEVAVAKEEMKHTHAIGESFSISEGLTAKVSDIQVSDDLSLLDPTLIDEDFKKETDENGKLRPATIQYVKNGDVDSLSEVIKSREVPQKLVYATVEYTNTGDKELSDVLFMGGLARIFEDGTEMKMMSGWTYEEPEDGAEWEMAVNKGLSSYMEMPYYDVHGGERGNNYIANIKPGETKTVHMAWVVTEEELGNLYINLDTYGGAYEFSDSALEIGYVDVRQK
ncbi:MAG: DUF4367 domain-containing protein [Lachnospiraceae bacterium]|jgi:hypothetical protein|nr:DUF4367 domain-containing protein [Lachnospiraceae bacterium]